MPGHNRRVSSHSPTTITWSMGACRAHGRPLGVIEDDGVGAAPVLRTQAARHLLETVGAARGQDQVEPLRGKHLGERFADPGGCARDEHRAT